MDQFANATDVAYLQPLDGYKEDKNLFYNLSDSKKAELKRSRFASKDSIQFEHVLDEDDIEYQIREPQGISMQNTISCMENQTGTLSSLSFAQAYQVMSLAARGLPLPKQWSSLTCGLPNFLPQAEDKFFILANRPSLNIDDGYNWKTIYNSSGHVDDVPVSCSVDQCNSSENGKVFRRETYNANSWHLLLYKNECDIGRQQSKAEEGSNMTNSRIVSSTSINPLKTSAHLNEEAKYSSPGYWNQRSLLNIAEELANGKVVRNMTVFPSIQVTMVHPDMTKEFERCCQILATAAENTQEHENDLCSSGIKLFYDTTFSLGTMYATILTFVNGCYEDDPVMPLAINLHEAKFKSSHQLFWARIVGDLPALQKYRFPLIIDDAEPAVHLAVRTQAPNLVQLESWTHRFRDIEVHLRGKGYGDEALNYFKSCITYLLNSESKQAMHDRYRKEFESVWPKDFVYYYRQRLLPRSGRLGKWAMLKLKIRDELFFCPHTNPQERFHLNCQYFYGWDTLNLDQLLRAFYFLFLYYISESFEGRLHSDSVFKVKESFLTSMGSTSRHLRASYKYIPHPSNIWKFVLQHYPVVNCKDATRNRIITLEQAKEQKWMAYGSTSTQVITGSTTHVNVESREMENLCDIKTELDDFINSSKPSLNGNNEDRSGSGGGGGGMEGGFNSSTASYCSRSDIPVLMNSGKLCSSSSSMGGPPSPAPNGFLGNIKSPSQAATKPSLMGMPNDAEIADQDLSSATTHTKKPPNCVFSLGLTPIPEVPTDSRASSIANINYLYNGAVTPQRGRLRREDELAAAAAAAAAAVVPPPSALPCAKSQVQNASSASQLAPECSDRDRQICMSQKDSRSSELKNTSSVKGDLESWKSHLGSSNDDGGGSTPSMMLWKKVQHYVVFGGAFITAGKDKQENCLDKSNGMAGGRK